MKYAMTMCYGYGYVPILDDLLVSAKKRGEWVYGTNEIARYTVIFFMHRFQKRMHLLGPFTRN